MKDLPQDTWVAVSEQDWLRKVYLVRLFKIDSETNERIAFSKDGMVHKVPEGAELPVYMEVTEELADVLEAFSHSYIVKQTFERVNT